MKVPRVLPLYGTTSAAYARGLPRVNRNRVQWRRYADSVRRDVRKVVFERAKSGRTWVSKTQRVKRVVLDGDAEHLNEGFNWLRPKRQKMRNQHYNALERFLVRSVGRSWKLVYAEVCAAVDRRDLLGSQIRDHVQACVATNCWLDGGLVMSHDWRGCPKPVRGLYVHPTSGALMKVR
jgi:hypothetical protein